MADFPISPVVRRVVYTGSAGVGPYAFTFEVLSQNDIDVFVNSTLQTLTTNYTVIINANGTGSVTLVVAATGTDRITIVGARDIQRASDYVTGGDFTAASLNVELDQQTIFNQQNAEALGRAILAPVTDPSSINMVLPSQTGRAGTVLAFNASTGNPEAGPSIGSVTTVAAQSANINTVATNIASVNTVAGNIANVNTVAGISSDVTMVATFQFNVNTVADDLNEPTSEINTVAVDIANVNAVGTNISNVNTVAGNNANVTTVAGISSNVTTVAGVAAGVTTVAGISSNVTTVAGVAANVTTVAGISSNVTTVANNNANVTTVAGSIANVNNVGGNIANVNQVAADTAVINSASANAATATTKAAEALASANSATASAAAASAVALGNEPVRHSVRPSLLLDFANTKTLDPRITYTRASAGTYYDGKTSAKAEENLFQRSQEFDNAYWNKGSGTTVTANSIAAPDGTTTAELVSLTAAFGGVWVNVPTTSGLQYTISFYAKVNTGTNTYNVWNDISGASIGTYTPTSDWVRYSFTFTAASTSASLWVAQDRNGSGYGSLYLWGAQLEQRSSVTAYTATTTAPITNYVPVLLSAPNNVARFEHNPVTGESLGLEIEEQRTNIITYTQAIGGTGWSLGAVNATLNANICPDGSLNASRIFENTANSQHNFNSALVTVSNSTIYTTSAYVKANGVQYVLIGTDGGGSYNSATFDIINGTFLRNNAIGSNFYVANSAAIQNVGNGWFRISAAFTTSSTSQYLGIKLNRPNQNSQDPTYVGDGTSGIFIWGAQLEAGAFATSYIPTVASQVTRSPDSASMTGSNLSSWFNPSEGTLYAESNHIVGVNQQAYFAQIAGTGAGTGYGASIAVGKFGDNAIDFGQRIKGFVYDNNSLVANLVTASNVTTSPVKVSIGYKVNDFAGSINGGTALTDTSGILPVIGTDGVFTIGALRNGGLYVNSTIKKLAYYTRRLTNAELVSLSTV